MDRAGSSFLRSLRLPLLILVVAVVVVVLLIAVRLLVVCRRSTVATLAYSPLQRHHGA